MVLSVAVHGQLALLLWPVVVSRWEGAQTGAKVLTQERCQKTKTKSKGLRSHNSFQEYAPVL